MKVIQKTLVAAGFATAVFATGAAQAATVSYPSTATVPAYANAIANNVARTVVDIPSFTINLGTSEDLSEDDSITLTVNGGGTWVQADETNLTDNGAGSYAVASGGTVGSTEVKYRVTAAPGQGSVITVAGLQINGSAVPDNGTTSIQVDMKGFVGGESTALFGTPLTTLSLELEPVYDVTFTVNTDTFSVATGFTTFLGDVPDPVTGFSDSGSAQITVATNADVITLNDVSATTGLPGGAPDTADILLTVSGPMTNVAAVTCSACTASNSAGVATVGATAGTMTIDTSANTATGFSTGLTNLIDIIVNGVGVNLATAYTAEVTTLTDSTNGYAASIVGSGTIHSFGRDGSSFATNSFGSKNKLTITDHSGATGTGGADGAVTLTAYDADGAAVTCTGLTIPNVEANATVTIQGADVLAACPGAKRIDGIVNSTTINVTNVKITADGATMQSDNNATNVLKQ